MRGRGKRDVKQARGTREEGRENLDAIGRESGSGAVVDGGSFDCSVGAGAVGGVGRGLSLA